MKSLSASTSGKMPQGAVSRSAGTPLVSPTDLFLVEEPSKELSKAHRTEYKVVTKKEFATDLQTLISSEYQYVPIFHFIITAPDMKTTSILTVCKNPEKIQNPTFSSLFDFGKVHKALLSYDGGYEEVLIPGIPSDSRENFEISVEQYLKSKLIAKEMEAYAVTQQEFLFELKKFEEKHSRGLKAFKVAILYVKGGQTSVDEIWKNQPSSDSSFYYFLDNIATRISMNSWAGYRGDIGVGGIDAELSAYHHQWRGVDIIYHVAPFMNAEQHRRLCVTLFYYDSDPASPPFNPSFANDLGGVPQVFGVIEPHPERSKKFRLAYFQRTAVGNYSPQSPPSSHYFSLDSMHDWFYTKLYNGVMKANASPPMDRLFSVPRRAAIRALGEMFPPESSKTGRRDRSNKKDEYNITSIHISSDDSLQLPTFAGAVKTDDRGLGALLAPSQPSKKSSKSKLSRSHPPSNKKPLHILLLGPSGVGRTSLLQRLSGNTFSLTTLPTGAANESEFLTIDSQDIFIISPPFEPDWTLKDYNEKQSNSIDGYIMCFDLNTPATIDHMASLLPSSEYSGPPILFWATKSDLGTTMKTPAWLPSRGFNLQQVSAKTGSNLKVSFDAFVSIINTPETSQQLREKFKTKDTKSKMGMSPRVASKSREKRSKSFNGDALDEDEFGALLEAGFTGKKS